MVNDWKNLRRAEQIQLIDAVADLSPEIMHRVLNAFHSVAGKEVRTHIETKLRRLD